MARSKTASAEMLTKARELLTRFKIDVDELTDEEVVEKFIKINKAKAQKAQVLSLGQTVGAIKRVLGKVPKGFVGELKRNTDLDIAEAESKGWIVYSSPDSVVDQEDSPTAGGDSSIRIGDCILMVIAEEDYVAMRLAEEERFRDRRAQRKRRHSLAGVAADKSDGTLPSDSEFFNFDG